MEVLDAVLPFTSVLVGSGITYVLNVRTRRTTKAEDVIHDAIAAVAIAAAATDYITRIEPWQGATPEEHATFTSELGREAHRSYVRAVAEARAAVARASAYEPALRAYLEIGSQHFVAHADEITAVLRRRIS